MPGFAIFYLFDSLGKNTRVVRQDVRQEKKTPRDVKKG